MQMNDHGMNELLAYELLAAERYRRYVTLVLAASRAESQLAASLLGETARECDAIIESEGALSILMSDTDEDGARRAVERFLAVGGASQDLCFSLVTYPNDGIEAGGLIERARERLEHALGATNGRVVASD